MQNKFPNLLLVGPGRSGTTSLFRYLSLSKDVCASNIKETNFFTSALWGEKNFDLSQYSDYFLCGDEKYLMECTPSYFMGGKKTAQIIRKYLGPVRIVLTLRNPVDKLFSLYSYHHGAGRLASDSFEDFLCKSKNFTLESLSDDDGLIYSGFYEGCYERHLKDWIDVFGKDNVYISFFESWISEPEYEAKRLFDWLGIDYENLSENVFPKYNQSQSYRLTFLHKFAQVANAYLEPVFNRNPSVRDMVRQIYTMINSKEKKHDLCEHMMSILYDEYYDEINELNRYLDDYGVAVPDWVRKES